MNINLKIEIIKIFTLEFSLSSNKDMPVKREKKDEKESATASSDTKQPSKS
jgi:hypothetical protein